MMTAETNWRAVGINIARFRVSDAIASPMIEDADDNQYIVVTFDGTMQTILREADCPDQSGDSYLTFATLPAAKDCAEYLGQTFVGSAFGVYIKGEVFKVVSL